MLVNIHGLRHAPKTTYIQVNFRISQNTRQYMQSYETSLTKTKQKRIATKNSRESAYSI